MPYLLIIFLIITSNSYAGCEDGDCNNGFGTYIWFNGDTDNRSWSHGDKYVGYFLNGQMHGQGTYYYVNGNSYTGSFSNGNMHGHGTFRYKSGKTYIGSFKKNLRHGKGILIDSNSNEKEVRYLNGRLIKI